MTHRPSPLAAPHGHSLADDMAAIATTHFAQRRRALGWLASAAGSALLLNACGGSGSSDDTSDSASTTTGTTTTGTTTTTASDTTTSGTCIADPEETAGPYPGDGTNNAAGSTSDVLTASGIVRSDIRASFIDSTTVADGVAVTLTLTLVNASASCTPLAGHVVYLWHCDRSGNYSLYSAPAESYLRGVQVADGSGQVSFTTIFPGCYAGRFPHMHFEVFANLAAATSGRNALLTSQLAMPADVCTAVYSGASGYAASVANFASVSTARDNVFGDNSAAQIAAMTPAMTGSIAAGYAATATIGLAV